MYINTFKYTPKDVSCQLCIRENTTRVWNTKAYLMAALFNSVSTIDNHYAMLVNHDFHGGP